MIYIFPTIKSSKFQRFLLKAPSERFEQSTKGPKPPEGRNIILADWPAHFEGSGFADEVGQRMGRLYEYAAYTLDQITKTKTDSRFTREGAQSRCLELVNNFITRGRLDGYDRNSAQNFRGMIEENAARLLTELELTRPGNPDPAIAAEWRSLIRNSHTSETGRTLFLKELMKGGEYEAGLAVIGAGRSLSGLSQDVYASLSDYVKVAANVDAMARIWNEAQMLDAARLALVRTTAEMVRLSGLPVEPTASITRFARELDKFDELKNRIESLDEAVAAFKGAELPQIDPEAEAPAEAPAEGA